MTKPKYAREFVDDLIKVKQLALELIDLTQKLVDEVVHGNAENELQKQEELYSADNPSPFGSAVGVKARIRWKESKDEGDAYFSFEKVDEETMHTPSGIFASEIFMVCTPKEFMSGFPLEPFELV
jgi:hypothetical protein